MTRPLNIVLVEPEIPQNTGNIARTCACTGARLHLVEPMGFRLTQKNLARAGCDYWDEVDIVRWPCAEAFFEAHAADELHLFTGQVCRGFGDVAYGEGSFLVFGRESRGLPLGSSRRTRTAACAYPCARACAASTCPTPWRWPPTRPCVSKVGRGWGRSCRLTQPSKRAFSRFSKIKRAEDVERVYT